MAVMTQFKHLWIILILIFFALVIAQDPIISNIEFKLSEEQRNGTFIGNIAAESNIGTDGYRFTILDNDNSEIKSKVHLNSTTGVLVTAQVINREQECSYERICELNFEVVANGDSYEILSVKILISDVNDNTPTFEESFKSFELSESKPMNYEITLTPAVDLDMGDNNGVSEYAFASKTEDFELKYEGSGSTSSLSLVLVNGLDHETTDSYDLLILAKDAGVPIRTGTLTVHIDVVDENDNKPVFINDIINVTVTEDIDVDKVIVVLQAKDKDSGKNGEVIYHLAKGQTADILNSFAINENTGELRVATKLDYEPDNAHKTIVIVAADKGDNPETAQATVYLTILDVGNNPPKVTLTYLEPEISPNNILVKENSVLNKTVVHVNVEDTDTGANGNVSCLTYNTYFGIKEVTSSVGRKGYKVFVQHLLDRESTDRHNVTVTCIDGGDMESSVSFVVTIKDENDNPPKFTSYDYRAEMKENNTYGAEIIQVSATDRDIGENGRVTYAIDPGSALDFEVEENTGMVRAKKSFDREDKEQEVFKVLAMDHGNPQRTSTSTLILTLLDVNDEVPQFTRIESFDVKENKPSNTYVDTVTATDKDIGDNKRLTFYLLPQYTKGGSHEVPFDIMEDDGRIITNRRLDREFKNRYEFEIGVRDHGVPSLNSSARVIVNVLDMNDETPYFIFPKPNNNTVVTLNQVSSIPITTILAADKDTGINKELMFFISEGNEEDIFSLDSESGDLFIVKYVHLTANKEYTMTIAVYDKGQPSLFIKEDLNILLEYTNITSVPQTDEGLSSNNIIIVVTVICITLLLSVTIITVICIIRRNDITKCGSKTDKFPTNLIRRRPKPGTNQQLANDKVYPEALQAKNRKEVSFSIEDAETYNQCMKENTILTNHQPPMTELPDELKDQSTNQPISILRTPQPFIQSPTKFLEHTDVPLAKPKPVRLRVEPESRYVKLAVVRKLNVAAPKLANISVSHHREDSHSETSAETATSQDSGNGGSETGDTQETPRPFELNQLNPTAYLIENGIPSVPPRKYGHSPVKSNPVHKQQIMDHHRPIYNEQNKNLHNKHVLNTNLSPQTIQNHNRTAEWRNWYLNSTSSYPDSDYMSSLGSTHNYSQTLMNRFPDNGLTWGVHNTNLSKMSALGYVNHGYGGGYHNYTSSTKDDDETTTTSGSYTINHEDLDEELANVTRNVSHVV